MKKLLNLVQKLICRKQEKFGKVQFENTVFCDFDGICVVHKYPPFNEMDTVLINTIIILKKLQDNKNYIVLTTGRKRKDCVKTLKFLKDYFNFEFDDFIFNLPTGKRIVLNDIKPNGNLTAFSSNFKRNLGLTEKKLYDFGFLGGK